MSETTKYPAELRERAIRMVREHRGDYGSEWAAIVSIAAKLGIAAPETLRKWIRRAEVYGGQRAGLTTPERERLVQLERENRELRRANEILKAAASFFARELDPRPPRL
jgi:transposase